MLAGENGVRVVEDQLAELFACCLLVDTEQSGDLGKSDLAEGVEGDGQGVGRGVCAERPDTGDDHAGGEDRRFRRRLRLRVEGLQRVDGAGERVVAEAALPWWDADLGGLAGDGVGTPGPPAEPVDRAVRGDVGVVVVVQLRAQLVERRVVGEVRCFGLDQLHVGVAQCQQQRQLTLLGLWYRVRRDDAVLHLAERAVFLMREVAVGASHARRHQRDGVGRVR